MHVDTSETFYKKTL